MTRFVLQLARIQTDSVAEKLKELYPDIHVEIGENEYFNNNDSDLISEPAGFPPEVLIDVSLKGGCVETPPFFFVLTGGFSLFQLPCRPPVIKSWTQRYQR